MQLGYHRVSDDSITSAWLEGTDLEARVRDIQASDDIDTAWLRATSDGPILANIKVPDGDL